MERHLNKSIKNNRFKVIIEKNDPVHGHLKICKFYQERLDSNGLWSIKLEIKNSLNYINHFYLNTNFNLTAII